MSTQKDWHQPSRLIATAIAVVLVLMVLLDMGPETTLVIAFGAFLGVTAWSVWSLSQTVSVAPPTPRAAVVPRTVGTDSRVRSLRTGILFGRNLGGHSDRLYQTLVELIDDQLMHAHGINREVDPDAAAAIIGPKLAVFVSDPEASASVADTKELTRIVTLIEQI